MRLAAHFHQLLVFGEVSIDVVLEGVPLNLLLLVKVLRIHLQLLSD